MALWHRANVTLWMGVVAASSIIQCFAGLEDVQVTEGPTQHADGAVIDKSWSSALEAVDTDNMHNVPVVPAELGPSVLEGYMREVVEPFGNQIEILRYAALNFTEETTFAPREVTFGYTGILKYDDQNVGQYALTISDYASEPSGQMHYLSRLVDTLRSVFQTATWTGVDAGEDSLLQPPVPCEVAMRPELAHEEAILPHPADPRKRRCKVKRIEYNPDFARSLFLPSLALRLGQRLWGCRRQAMQTAHLYTVETQFLMVAKGGYERRLELA